MTTLQLQARALGDPTRHGIFRFLVAGRGPVGIAEINAEFPLNHNAIRQHLAKLVAAGLVVERREGAGRPGRPRLVYEVAPGVDSRWGPTGPFERLSLLLGEIIDTGDDAVDVGRRAGRELAAATAGTAATAEGGAPPDTVERMTAVMAQQGFEPEARRKARTAEIVLHHCPFASAALAHRDTVCTLHLGIAEGIAEGTEVAVTELVAKDPRRASCRIRLRVVDDG